MWIPPSFRVAAVLVLVWSGAGAAQTDRLVPVDEAARDPEFFLFRARLQRAIAAGDTAAIIERTDPGVRLSFGGEGGHQSLRARLRDPAYRADLAEALALGGAFTSDSTFTAPYTFVLFPEDLDPFASYVVLGERVRMRAGPSLDAPVRRLLSYDIVVRDMEADRDLPDGWSAIRADDGGTGYVATRFLRGPLDYRALFLRRDGRWWLVAFVAGD